MRITAGCSTKNARAYSHRVRKVEPNGVAKIIAGSGDPVSTPIEGYYFVGGYSGDGGPATSAQLNFPWGVAVGAAGNIYIADSLNNRIRKVTTETGSSVTGVTFTPTSIPIGEPFTATFSGTNLTDKTYFDVRFRGPGSTIDEVVLDWQQGTSETHTVPMVRLREPGL